MTKSAKFIHKVLTELGDEPPASIKICRTHAGRHQRSSGAWSWFALNEEDGMEIIGSIYPVSSLMKAEKVEIYVHPHTLSRELQIADNRRRL